MIRGKVSRPMAIDYSQLALPKSGRRPKHDRASRRRAKQRAANSDRDGDVLPRYQGQCIAYGISPVCTARAEHPHEVIPQSKGGPQEAWNRVPICAVDHRECQGRVGGNRLKFGWVGPSPTCHIKGTTSVTWRPTGRTVWK